MGVYKIHWPWFGRRFLKYIKFWCILLYIYLYIFTHRDFRNKKWCSVRLFLQLFVGVLMSYLRYLCLFGSSFPPVVCRSTHVLFTLFLFVCVQWCPIHIVLCFSFACLRLVYPVLPIFLDCPFLIALSVFSNVYL